MSLCVDEGRARAVARDDAGAFLAAMLQREQTVVSQHRGVRMTEHGENAAFVLREDVRYRAHQPCRGLSQASTRNDSTSFESDSIASLRSSGE